MEVGEEGRGEGGVEIYKEVGRVCACGRGGLILEIEIITVRLRVLVGKYPKE